MSGATFPESSETELDHWLLSADLVPSTFLETSLKAELKLLRVMLVAYSFVTGLRHKASGSKGTEVLPLNYGILGKISPFTITRSVPSLNRHKQNKMFIDDGQMHLQ